MKINVQTAGPRSVRKSFNNTNPEHMLIYKQQAGVREKQASVCHNTVLNYV